MPADDPAASPADEAAKMASSEDIEKIKKILNDLD